MQPGDDVIWPEAEENGYHGHFTVLGIFPSRFLKDKAGVGLPTALIEPVDSVSFCIQMLDEAHAENELIRIEVPIEMLQLLSNRVLH